MIEYALLFTAACYGVALLLDLWRIAAGPDEADRILALDTMVINVIALLIIYGIWQGTAIYYEASMLVAITLIPTASARLKFGTENRYAGTGDAAGKRLDFGARVTRMVDALIRSPRRRLTNPSGSPR